MPVELAVELSKHPNIVGMKDSGGDIAKIGQIIAETGNSPDNFCLLAGSASFLLPALNVGAVGGICALANALPEECVNLQDLFCKLHTYLLNQISEVFVCDAQQKFMLHFIGRSSFSQPEKWKKEFYDDY